MKHPSFNKRIQQVELLNELAVNGINLVAAEDEDLTVLEELNSLRLVSGVAQSRWYIIREGYLARAGNKVPCEQIFTCFIGLEVDMVIAIFGNKTACSIRRTSNTRCTCTTS